MRLLKSFVVALLVLACAVPALAAESNPGSGNRGFTLAVGYDAGYLDYEEKPVEDYFLDGDSGWMDGVNVEARFETKGLWTRARFDYSRTDDAEYDGALMDGTPLKMRTSEKFWLYEGDIGYKLLDESTATLTPYGGVGYRSWTRGEDVLPGYREKYTWWYAAAGANCDWRLKRWSIGLDIAAVIPFAAKMKTDIAGLIDEATFNIKGQVGFKAELPVTFDLYQSEKGLSKFFVFATPYYQHWRIGSSDAVEVSIEGTPTDLFFYEPRSMTDVYGANIGLGVNF